MDGLDISTLRHGPFCQNTTLHFLPLSFGHIALSLPVTPVAPSLNLLFRLPSHHLRPFHLSFVSLLLTYVIFSIVLHRPIYPSPSPITPPPPLTLRSSHLHQSPLSSSNYIHHRPSVHPRCRPYLNERESWERGEEI